jgi:predicted RNase H-like nuclease
MARGDGVRIVNECTVNVDAKGVDGCRGGWVIAARAGVRVVARLSSTLAGTGIVGIDMPIGLPRRWGRSCDRMARERLGSRRSSIFDTPPRALLGAHSYDAAAARSRELFGRGLSVQSFHLLAKIAEVDRLVSPASEHRILEVHPESTFTLMAGRSLAPKREAKGAQQRRALLEPIFGPLPARVPGAAAHDVLDAYAVLWSVERFARDEHIELGDGQRDARGLLMRIVI